MICTTDISFSETLADWQAMLSSQETLIAQEMNILEKARLLCVEVLMRREVNAAVQDLPLIVAEAFRRLACLAPSKGAMLHPIVANLCESAEQLLREGDHGEWLKEGFRAKLKALLQPLLFLESLYRELHRLAVGRPVEITESHSQTVLRIFRFI